MVLPLASGCFSNSVESLTSSSGSGSSVGSGDPQSGLEGIINNGTTDPITISRVILNSLKPDSQFDLIGDGSGKMLAFCQATSGQSGAASGSTCTCVYKYTTSDGTVGNFEVNPAYQEDNLLRCNYDGLPGDLKTVAVKIHLTASDTYSNEIRFQFNESGVVLNTRDPESFVKVRRYQCGDSVPVNNPFNDQADGPYDPFLSNLPEINYPLNFYTSNFAGTMGVWLDDNKNPHAEGNKGNGKGVGFNCPTNPNIISGNNDMRIFSEKSDGQSKLIYPPDGSKMDRSLFYLARKKSGIFSMPVNTFAAPSLNTAEGTAHPPVGYGAAPIPLDQDTETCPDASYLPTGYRWVKIWLFRSNLPPRVIPYPNGISDLSALLCNSGGKDDGKWKETVYSQNQAGTTPDPLMQYLFPSCGIPAMMSGAGTGMADRITLGQACFRLQGIPTVASESCKDQMGMGCTTVDNGSAQKSDGASENYALGTDVWKPLGGQNSDALKGLALQPALGGVIPEVTSANGVSKRDMDGGVPRFDFLIVASPITVMFKHMKNGTSEALPYTPYRFKHSYDCSSSDPDLADENKPNDCNPSNILHYGFKGHDISTNGDEPPGQNSARLPRFPVCAVQPIL